MQNVWNGYGIPAMNMVWTEVFFPASVPILLSDTPGAVTRVNLDATAHGVCLWAVTSRVWYAVDTDPGPIPAPASGIVIDASVFRTGGILMPNQWYSLALPDDSLPHNLRLVSEDMSPLVYLSVLLEQAL